MKRLIGMVMLGATALAGAQIQSPQAAGWLDRARAMMNDRNYTGAIDQLRDGTVAPGEERDFLEAKAKYERADADAPAALRNFVRNWPASVLAGEAQLMEGDYYFYAHDYGEALRIYDAVDLSALPSRLLRRAEYRRGVCLVKIGEFGEAEMIFRRLEHEKGMAEEARFYLGYIDYARGNLDKAYSVFKSLDDVEAGYYCAQIEYSRGDYAQAVATAESLIRKYGNTLEPGMEPELHRLLGESAWRLGRTSEAEKYLRLYVRETDYPNDSAVYALGTILYDQGDYEQAAELFQRLTDLNNSLAQSAYLFLGQCAERQGDANAASMAFLQAYQMNFDRSVTESALYNYATAVANGGNTPFTSSVEVMEDFLSRFPSSRFAPSVEQYLATAYYNDRNYSKALASINRIKNPGADVLAAKQKILYECGVEAVNNGRPAEAAQYFAEAAAMKGQDAALAAQCSLWQGDALFRAGEYSEARKAFETYFSRAGSARGANYTLALYDYAYTLYELGSYREAAAKFSEALAARPALDKALQNDARIRLADCQYYTKSWRSAADNYSAAIAAGAADSDYAAYRHAVMTGLLGDVNAKIRELDALAGKYPGSKWLAPANLEKALTLQGLGRHTDAIATYEDLIRSYPNEAVSRQATLELAQTYAEAGQQARSIETYKKVISTWPTSDEARMAHQDLQLAMASAGRLDEYSKFLERIPNGPRMDADKIEALSYEAASLDYGANGNVDKLKKYIEDYPSGANVAEALSTLADAAVDSGDDSGAILYIDRLLKEYPHSRQVPYALMLKAEIVEDDDPKTANALYSELLKKGGANFREDAVAGLMRTTSKEAERLQYAEEVLKSNPENSDLGMEALSFKAAALKALGRGSEAAEINRRLAASPSSLWGSKAAVDLGQHYLDAGRPSDARKVLDAFTKSGTPHSYWLARGYIALADAYKAEGNKVTALEYIRSLKDNYPGSEADIASMINTRLKSWKQ